MSGHTPGPWAYNSNHMVVYCESHPYATEGETDIGGRWQGLETNNLGEVCSITRHIVHNFSQSKQRCPPDPKIVKSSSDRDDANARLITAAPRMYDYIEARAQSGDAEAAQILEGIHASR